MICFDPDQLPEVISLTCGWCGGKEMHGQGEDGPCEVCKDTGKVLVEKTSLLARLRSGSSMPDPPQNIEFREGQIIRR